MGKELLEELEPWSLVCWTPSLSVLSASSGLPGQPEEDLETGQGLARGEGLRWEGLAKGEGLRWEGAAWDMDC